MEDAPPSKRRRGIPPVGYQEGVPKRASQVAEMQPPPSPKRHRYHTEFPPGAPRNDPDTPLTDLGISPEYTVNKRVPKRYPVKSIDRDIGGIYMFPGETVGNAKEKLIDLLSQGGDNQQWYISLQCDPALDGRPLTLDDRGTGPVFCPLANTAVKLNDTMKIETTGIRGFWVGNYFPRCPVSSFRVFIKDETLTTQDWMEADTWTELHRCYNCSVNAYAISKDNKAPVISHRRVEQIVMSPPPTPPRKNKGKKDSKRSE